MFAQQANVRIINSSPLEYDSGFAGNETADSKCAKEMSEVSDSNILLVSCGLRAAGEDIWIPGVKFELLTGIKMVYGNFRRLIGYGAPIMIFMVKDYNSSVIGCSMGPLSDYVTVKGGSSSCIAHELAHACNL